MSKSDYMKRGDVTYSHTHRHSLLKFPFLFYFGLAWAHTWDLDSGLSIRPKQVSSLLPRIRFLIPHHITLKITFHGHGSFLILSTMRSIAIDHLAVMHIPFLYAQVMHLTSHNSRPQASVLSLSRMSSPIRTLVTYPARSWPWSCTRDGAHFIRTRTSGRSAPLVLVPVPLSV